MCDLEEMMRGLQTPGDRAKRFARSQFIESDPEKDERIANSRSDQSQRVAILESDAPSIYPSKLEGRMIIGRILSSSSERKRIANFLCCDPDKDSDPGDR